MASGYRGWCLSGWGKNPWKREKRESLFGIVLWFWSNNNYAPKGLIMELDSLCGVWLNGFILDRKNGIR